jgi:hypothetical protein
MPSMSTSVRTVGRNLKFAKLLVKMTGASCYNLSCPKFVAKMIRE